MVNTQTNSRIGLIGLICALGLCGGQLSFGGAFLHSYSSARAGWMSARGAEGHGDDDEDDEEQEQDEEEEDDDEDDDEEEPWQVRPLNGCQAPARTAGTPLCVPSRLAVLRSRISP
jgi:hypothetical protein